MNKAVFQVFAGVLLGVAILLAGFIGYFYLNQDKIVDVLINEINRKVDTKIDVGSASMSFWERFPGISVKFENVTVHNASAYKGNQSDTLLFAQQLFFDLNVRTLISKTPKISRLSVANGKIILATDASANNNYDIFPQEQSTTKKSAKELRIDAFELEKMQINFHDERKNISFKNRIKYANIEGVINAETFNLNVEVELAKTNLIPARYNYFSTYKWTGKIARLKENIFQWNGKLETAGFISQVQGNYNPREKSTMLTSTNIELRKPVMNEIFRRERIKKIEVLEGALHIKSFDYFDKANTRQVHAVFQGDPVVKIFDKQVSMSFEGQLTNDGTNSLVNFDFFDAIYGESNLHFEGNYRHPQKHIRGYTSFNANLNDWQSEFGKLPVTNLNGLVDGQAKVDGRLTAGFSSFFTEGELGLQQVSLDLRKNNLSIKQLNSIMEINPENILIKKLNGNFNQNKLQFNGEVSSVFKFLLENQPLLIRGKAKAEKFNLNDYLLMSDEEQSGEPFQLTDNIRLQIETNIAELVQNKFQAKNFSAKINKFGKRIEMPDLYMETARGKVRAEGKLVQQGNNEWFVQLNGHLDNVDVAETFRQFQNFGQTEINARHISGKLNASVRSEFVFSPRFKVRPASIYLWSDIVVENGKLNNYETLQKLAGFISVEELKNVQFEKLQNQITIVNQTVKIPYMEIKSSAIDLDLTGTHTFNNVMEYEISVGLADVLFNKLRRKHTNTFAWKKNNKTMVAVDIKGTNEDYKVSFKNVKRKKVDPEPTNKTRGKKKKFQIEFDDM